MSVLDKVLRKGWRAFEWARAQVAPVSQTDPKAAYTRFVENVKGRMPYDQAMEMAIGGGFDVIGPIEVALLRRSGLAADGYLIDVGCGSGRLAKPLAASHTGRYLGIDVVAALVKHARQTVGRPDWRFEAVDHIGIPEEDGQADMVCFFSVLTHLLHEQSFWYLEEARRVLKPGGLIVFSFLEFAEPAHMPVFWQTLATAKARGEFPLNVFIERNAIQRWADALGLELLELHEGPSAIVPEGPLGQSVAVLRKPA